jgi:hypothetical protein
VSVLYRLWVQSSPAQQTAEESQEGEEEQTAQDGQEEVVAIMQPGYYERFLAEHGHTIFGAKMDDMPPNYYRRRAGMKYPDQIDNIPVRGLDGSFIGTGTYWGDGKFSFSIHPEFGKTMAEFLKQGVSNSLSIGPVLVPAVRAEPDTRPVYKKRNPFVNDTVDIFMAKARKLVRMYIEARLDKSDPPVEFEVYLVWFNKTLQNWKALVSSTLPDGMYYEVTYNGDERETYIDAYKKVENVKVPDTLEQTGFEILEFDQSGKTRGSDELLG